MNQFLHLIKKYIPTALFKKMQPYYHLTFSWLAAFVYRYPAEKLIVIGVTGTTGKTTVIHLVAKVLEAAGYRVGYTSTAMFKVADKELNNDKKMTMLGRFFTQRMLRRMVREGCHYAIVETTSQGIEQFRHRFINYDVCVFTGIYPEHIEAHGGFANYKAAKLKLFKHLSTCKPKYTDDKKRVQVIKNEIKKIHCEKVKKTIIVNGEDEYATEFLNFNVDEKWEFRIQNSEIRNMNEQPMSRVVATHTVADSTGIHFKINDEVFDLQLMGAFNVSNALAAVAVGLSQELSLPDIKKGLEGVSGVPGRFERINEGQDFTIIVDYAFEPNALTKLYETIAGMKSADTRVIHVLGATGGGRDISRRAILGRIAGEHADVVIATNEDPYDDDPQIIIDQVTIGAEKAGKVLSENLFNILDRREAIIKALQLAQTGDIVLVTGKGNEQTMAVAGGKLTPWDDRQVVRDELGKVYPVK